MKGQKGYLLVQKGSASRFSFKSLLHTVQRWRQLAWQRNELAQMSDDALKDIGMSRADVSRETQRPFWDDPMKK